MLKIVHSLEDLIEKYDEYPFVIGAASIKMIGVYDIEVRDYFILKIKKGKISKKIGNVEIMELSNLTRRQFLSRINLFEITQDNADGKIYELKSNPGYFKSKFKINNSLKEEYLRSQEDHLRSHIKRGNR